MGFLLPLLGNKNVWIAVVIAILTGGIWLKIHSLNNDVLKAQKALVEQTTANALLQGNNATLKQNLDLALSVNDQNAKLLETIKVDQETAATSLRNLSTDLSHARITLSEAKRRLADTKLPSIPVPQNIIEAITTIQQSRVEQAEINKKLEAVQ